MTKKAKVHVFVDNSNIFLSAKDVAKKIEGHTSNNRVRLHFGNIFELAIANRDIGKICVVGSIPPGHDELWQNLESAAGVKPELYERGELGGKEQGVDQCLQVHMLRSSSDHPDDPQVAVLLTGDGAGYDTGVGFHADMRRLHEAGWGVEVLSWRNNCKRDLKEWADANGTFIALDDYYNSVTFLELDANNGTPPRFAQPVDLKARKVSHPRLSESRKKELKIQQEKDSEIYRLQQQIKALEEAQKNKIRAKEKHDKRFLKNK